MRKIKSRLGFWASLLGLPLLLAPLLLASAGQGEGGAGAGGDGPAGPTGDGDGDGGAGDGAPAAKLTQADVDRIVEDRLARERKKFADYDDVKAKAAKFDEAEAKTKPELEREREQRVAAEKRAADATSNAQKALRKAAILVAAREAADADDVFALIEANPTKYEVTVGDDGQVTGAVDAVKALLKAKPHLVGKSPTSVGSADGGPRGSGGDKPKTLEDAVSRALAKSG